MDAKEWIALLKQEATELRKLGILSLACDGMSAVLAPADQALDDKDDNEDSSDAIETEPSNAWENPASYPSGNVPSIRDVDPADKLPPIEEFAD